MTLLRRSSVDLALDSLRHRILSGEFPDGTPLRQDALAAELGVSRIPVREALRRLEAEGLVTITAHHGAVVPVASLSEIEELFDLRALIEGSLMRRAVERRTDETLQRAAAALDAYDAALADGEVGDWGRHNWAFHSALLDAASRPVGLELAASLHNRCDRYMRMQLSLTHGEDRARAEHREILDAAAARDAERASALVEAHVRRAGEALVDFMREHRKSDGERQRT